MRRSGMRPAYRLRLNADPADNRANNEQDEEPVAGIDQQEPPGAADETVVHHMVVRTKPNHRNAAEIMPLRRVTWPAPRWPSTPASIQAISAMNA